MHFQAIVTCIVYRVHCYTSDKEGVKTLRVYNLVSDFSRALTDKEDRHTMGNSRSSLQLQPEDLAVVQEETGFTPQQIERLYSRYIEQPSQQIERLYSRYRMVPPQQIERLYSK